MLLKYRIPYSESRVQYSTGVSFDEQGCIKISVSDPFSFDPDLNPAF